MHADRCLIGLATFLLASTVAAQVPPANVALPNPYAITFQDIACAETTHDYSLTQMRFALVVDPTTGIERWSGFLESLELAPAIQGSTKPRFDLSLASGMGLDPAEEARQASVHSSHEAFLQLHSTFRVQDPALAARNYTIQFDGAGYRLGRPVYSVSILPNDPTRNGWMLELDVQTGYPLSRSHYSPAGQLLGMVVVTSFSHGQPAVQSRASQPPTWWASTRSIDYPSPEAAAKAMSIPPKLVSPIATTSFELHETRVTTDPLTGDETLVMAFTDGIASRFHLQTPGAPMPNLPALVSAKGQKEIGVLDFTDLTTRQLMFHTGHAMHIVVGDAHDPELERLTERILLGLAY